MTDETTYTYHGKPIEDLRLYAERFRFLIDFVEFRGGTWRISPIGGLEYADVKMNMLEKIVIDCFLALGGFEHHNNPTVDAPQKADHDA